MLDLTQYKTKNDFQMPADDINPASKAEPAYFLQCMKYFYSMYAKNFCLLPYAAQARSFATLRAYGDGKQPVEKYMNILYPPDSFQRKRNMAFNNVSRDIVRVIPKFLNTVMGIFTQLDYDFDAAFIDPTSTKLKEEEKAWLKLMLNEKYLEFLQEIGITPSKATQQTNTPQFNSAAQVDIYFQSGGFQLDTEIAIRNLLTLTIDDSNWPVIQKMLLKDILTIGINACEDYVDTDMRVKGKYIDPDRLICRYSQYPDHHDIDFAGYEEEVTLSDLRRTGEFNDVALARISKLYSGELNNGSYSNTYDKNYQRQFFHQFKCYPNDDQRATIMQMYWISPDIDNYLNGVRPSDGTMLTQSVPFDFKIKDRQVKDGINLHKSNIDYVYKCKWVVGTDFVYDYGKLDFVPREIKKTTAGQQFRRARLPIHIHRLEGPSMVEMCVEPADQIQLDTMRLRALKTKIPNAPAMFVVKEALEGITLGGIKMGPRDIMDMFQEDGWGVLQKLDDFQNSNGTVGSPLIPVDLSNIYNLVKTYREEISLSFSDIRTYTGISEIVDGTTPAPRTGLGIANISVGASNNSIFSWRQCYELNYLSLLKNAVLRWQIVNQTENIDSLFRPFGSETTKIMSLPKNALNGECALKLTLRSSEQEILETVRDAAQLKANRVTTGSGGITPAQYIQVVNIARTGNLKLAQLYMASAEETTRENDIKAQMQLNEQKAQSDQQTALATQAMQKDTLSFEWELKTKYMMAEQEQQRLTDANKYGIQHKTAVDQAKVSQGEPINEDMKSAASQGYGVPPPGTVADPVSAPAELPMNPTGMQSMPEVTQQPMQNIQ